MSAIPPILVQIQADVSALKAGLAQAEAGIKGLNSSVDTASTGMSSMMSRVKTLGATMGVVFGAQQVMKFGNDVIQAASNMNESLSKVQVVFGENSKAVEDFAKNASKNMGLSNQKALEAAGTYGNLFQAFGIARGSATQMSTTLVQLAADLASFNNTSTEDALMALRSGLSGETEPLKRFGVALNEVTLKNKALQMGLITSTTGVLPPAIKAQATYALVMEQTKSAQGDYARTADGVANKQRTLAAQFEDTKAKIGAGLLPIYQIMLKVLQVGVLPALEMFGSFLSNNKEVIAVFTAALLIGATAWGAYKLAMKVANFEMATFSKLAKANPIGLIVTAVSLLAAAFVYAWNHSETFRKVVVSVAKGVLSYISFMIRAWGEMITIIFKVVTGPMHLFLSVLSHLPGVGKYAKEGLDLINKGIGGVGNFADTVANKVDGFKKSLDGLADKKIAFNTGGGMATQGADFVTPFVADTTTAKNADKLKAEAKKVQDVYDKMNEAISDGKDKLNEELLKKQDRDLKITEKFNERKAELENNYAKTIVQITKDYNSKLTDIQTKRDEDEITAKQNALEKMASIVKQSVDRLRSAFASGTAFSVTDAFKESGSVDDLITQFTDKLKAAKELQANAAALAGMGYSQTFIEEVVKSGPEAGNKLAEALKKADPTKTGQLQDLYKQLQSTSEHGLDALSETMNSGGKLATDELLDAYKGVSVELTQTLNKINSDYQKANAEALADSTEKLAQAKLDFDEALASAQKDMADSLLESQKDYLKAVDDINKATQDKLIDLKKNLAEIAATMSSLGAAKSAQLALAGAPTYGNTTNVGDTYIDNSQDVKVYAQTDANPNDISKSVLDAIKYGNVITANATWTPNYTSPYSNKTTARASAISGTSVRGD